jgi:GntR family transcriptional regulator / MocR family aminotransferase
MVQLDRDGPLYRQIYAALRRSILEGDYPAGSRVPSTRALTASLNVSRNVVLLAFEQLAAEGYLEGRPGSGTYVVSPLPDAAAPGTGAPAAPALSTPVRLSRYGRRALASAPALRASTPLAFDFRYGLAPPDSRSLTVWRRLLARHAASQPLDYAPPEGHPALRAALAVHLRRNRGVVCDPDQVLVVSGSQQALDLVARVLLDPGDAVVIEEPHYQGARQVLQAAGATLVPVGVDGEGLDPRAIRAGRRRVRLAYVTPSHQFPTGAVMPLSRRLALLEWAHARDAFVVEDDYDSEYRYEGRPVEAVQGLDRRGRTIYLGTLSKVLFPSIRLGFVVLPPALVPAFTACKWLADRHTSVLEQSALAEFLRTGQFERHLRRMRRLHARRREALIAALNEHLGRRVTVMGTQAGIHLLAWLPGVPARRTPHIVRRAAEAGVGVYSVAPYYLDPPRRAGLTFKLDNIICQW